VAVDSVVPGRTRGTICDERLAWLDRTLSARPDAQGHVRRILWRRVEAK